MFPSSSGYPRGVFLAPPRGGVRREVYGVGTTERRQVLPYLYIYIYIVYLKLVDPRRTQSKNTLTVRIHVLILTKRGRVDRIQLN